MPEIDSLVAASVAGDEPSLRRLLVVCQPDLRRYARHYCPTSDIDDAVQDSLIIIHRRLAGLRTIAHFSAWVFQIVKRACLRRLRRGRDVSLDDETANTLRAPGDVELQLDVTGAILSLPPLYRGVVILRDVRGFSADETAALLTLSVQAVKSRLHRGRALVRDRLQAP